MEKQFYKIIKTSGKIYFPEDNIENKAYSTICAIPRFSKVSNNCGSSWGNPARSERFRQWLESLELPDGNYIAEFDYEYNRCGWARGSNWYGCMLYQAS